MSKHALLSPSSAARWMACPPSARLEAQYPDTTSDAAEEGTLAHRLGEYKLRLQFNCGATATPEELAEIKASKWYSEEVERYATEYADFVAGRYAEACRITPDAALFVESRLDLRHLMPDAFGTADAVIIADGLLQVIDLKYGKGVAVSAENNPQAMIYAAGAARMYGVAYNVDRVQMYIYQPRLDSCTSFTMSIKDLESWTEETLIPAARAAYAGGGEQTPGDHCRFCRARIHCQALHDMALRLAREDFSAVADGGTVGDERVAEVLAVADTVAAYLTAVKGYALDRALGGHTWAGFKLVEGRSVRQVADEAGLVAALTACGADEQDLYARKIKGLGELQKAVGKQMFEEVAAKFLVKPAGSPTLVPDSDKRPAMSRAADDFKENQ